MLSASGRISRARWRSGELCGFDLGMKSELPFTHYKRRGAGWLLLPSPPLRVEPNQKLFVLGSLFRLFLLVLLLIVLRTLVAHHELLSQTVQAVPKNQSLACREDYSMNLQDRGSTIFAFNAFGRPPHGCKISRAAAAALIASAS